MKTEKLVTRRSFIKVFTIISGVVVTGIHFTGKAFAEAVNIVAARNRSTYEQDARMQYRKSQDNPAVKQIYKEFLHAPNSHEAHHLLHTEYTDRSGNITRLKERGYRISL